MTPSEPQRDSPMRSEDRPAKQRLGELPLAVVWLAHVYTALGLPLAVGMLVAILRGDAEGYRWAFVCMLAATLVDATDGSLARKLNVKERLPNFDGTLLDNLIDFLTFTSLPLLMMWHAELLPPAASGVLIVALVASGYGFCQVPAKTTDGYFVGFPSYWNIVAFYLYVLQIPPWIAAGLTLLLALMTFVPSYYMYPSRGATLSRLTNFLGGVWVVMLLAVLGTLPGAGEASSASDVRQNQTLALLSLFYPIYYMTVSWAITIDRWRRAKARG